MDGELLMTTGRPLQIPSGLAGAPSHVPEQQPPAILGILRLPVYLVTITLYFVQYF